MYIFFDLDGTLIDTLPDIHASVNKALVTNQLLPISFQEAKSFIGHGSTNLMTKASKGQFSPKLLTDYLTIYHENLHNLSKPYPDALLTLEKLKKAGFILGVYSNKDEKDVTKIIDYYFPNIFTYILGKKANYPLKPDPTLMDELIKINNINKSDFIYVGDMQTDADLAKNLEVKFVYCSYGYNSSNISCNYKIAKFVDLLEVI